jgi:hypothetical protein
MKGKWSELLRPFVLSLNFLELRTDDLPRTPLPLGSCVNKLGDAEVQLHCVESYGDHPHYGDTKDVGGAWRERRPALGLRWIFPGT